MTALTISGLRVVLGGVEVVAGIGLSVEEGEWLGVIGPNGAGKTTVLRAIAGTVPAAGGTMMLFGEPAHGLGRAQRARMVASVPQRPVIPADMRVIDYVLLGRAPHVGYLASESPADIGATQEALRSLDLTPLGDRRLGDLSGGEVQRAVLGRALAQGSPLLLLDEPTTALDVGHQQQVMGMVDAMRRGTGLTVVSAIHDLTLAARYCNRLVMLAGGRVVADGAPADVLTEPTIREHFGASVSIIDDGSGGLVVVPLREDSEAALHDTMAAET